MGEKRIGIWIRVSTEFQVKDESPEVHEKRARYYAEAKGWIVEKVYRLDAMSGKAVNEYPETKQMLRDIADGKIEGLIFSKLARLARNTRELLEFAEIFRKYDADLISLSENIDTSTPSGRLFYTMIAAMAQWEREEIADRVAASVPVRAKMGKPLGGQASFGYTWEDANYVVDEKEAPIRKLIYEIFLRTKRKKTTATELNKMGFRTRNGSAFSDTTIDRLLRDPSAKGMRRANYTKSLGEKKNWVIKDEKDWIYQPCPPIVSVDVWEECNRILEAQERVRVGRQTTHLLAGLIHCDCGKKMYVYSNKALHYKCRPCDRKISVDDINEIFQEQLKTFLFSDHDLSSYLDNNNDVIKEKEHLIENLLNEAKSLEKKMKQFIDMRLEETISKENFTLYYTPIEQQHAQIQERLPELQAEVDILKVQFLSSDSVIQSAQDLYQQWGDIPHEDKRSIVELITEKITIGKEDIEISLSYLPSPLNRGKKQHNLRDSWRRST